MLALLPMLVSQVIVGPHGVRSGNTIIDHSGIHTASARGQVSIVRNLTVRFYRGDGRTFNVSGNNNRITIRGNAARIVVNGNGNTVRVDGVGVVEVPGNRNHVVYARGLAGRPARVVVLGSRNTVGHQ